MKRDELEQQIDLGLRGLSRSGAGHKGTGPAHAADDGHAASAAPDMHAAWAAAHTRAASLRRRNTMRNTTLMLLLAGLLTVAGLTLWPRGNGWAVTDGWIVEYEIEVPAYYDFDYGVNGAKDPTAPQDRLEQLVADWNEAHKDKAQLPGQPLATLKVMPAAKDSDEPLLKRATAQLSFASDDQALLDELTELLRNPGEGLPQMIGVPLRYSRTWYANEKYPERYEPREIVIDGKPYSFPTDFESEDELENFRDTVLPHAQNFGGLGENKLDKETRPAMLYYNLLSKRTIQKTGAGMVLLMSVDSQDRILLDTLVRDDPFAEFALRECQAQGLNAIPGKGMTLEECLGLMRHGLEVVRRQTTKSGRAIEVYQFTCLAYPTVSFELGQGAGKYTPSVSESLRAKQQSDRYLQAVNSWLAEHQELRIPDQVWSSEGDPPKPVPERHVAARPVYGSIRTFVPGANNSPEELAAAIVPVVAIQVEMHGLSSEDRVSLRSALESVAGSQQVIEWRLSDQKLPLEEDKSE